MEYINQTTRFIENQLSYPLANPYIMAVLKLSLVLYAVQIAPRAPEYLQELFKNTYVKVGLITLIIYLSGRDMQLAILLAIIYVFGMNLLSGRGALESFSNYSSEYKSSGVVLLEPKLAIYPGCDSITMQDLYKMFDGDKTKFNNSVQYAFQELMARTKTKDSKEMLMKIAYAAGLPYNMSFDKPETAPYIATLLVNYGYKVSDSCQPPNN
jgi:hypothetical protein